MARDLYARAQALAARPLARRGWFAPSRLVNVGLFAFIVVDVALGWNIFDTVRQTLAPQQGALPPALRLPWIIAALFLAVLVHELGHVVGALMSRRRVIAIAVVPLLLAVRPFSLRFHVSLFRGDVGGFVRTDAVTGELRRSDIPLYAGGIVANLIAWIVAREWSIAEGPTSASAMASTFAFLNVALAIGNAVPYRLANGFHSDGKWLLDLALGRRPTGLQAISSIIGKPDMRPRTWPQEVIEGLREASASQRSEGLVPLLLYAHAVDRGRTEEAFTALCEVLDARPTSERFRTAFLMQAAWFTGWQLRDPARGRAMLALSPRAPQTQPYLFHNALAAIEQVEGRHQEALASVGTARRAAAATGIQLAVDDREALDEVERAAGRSLGTIPAV